VRIAFGPVPSRRLGRSLGSTRYHPRYIPICVFAASWVEPRQRKTVPRDSRKGEEMMFSENAVRDALEGVMDPELKRSLVDLHMVRNIQTGTDDVRVTLVLTTLGCPMKHRIDQEVKEAVPEVERFQVARRAYPCWGHSPGYRDQKGRGRRSAHRDRFSGILNRAGIPPNGQVGDGHALSIAVLSQTLPPHALSA
jgi:metal-sulfur cluster biosynthetic enzyme